MDDDDDDEDMVAAVAAVNSAKGAAATPAAPVAVEEPKATTKSGFEMTGIPEPTVAQMFPPV